MDAGSQGRHFLAIEASCLPSFTSLAAVVINGGIEKRICRQRIFLLIYKTRKKSPIRKGRFRWRAEGGHGGNSARPAVILKNRFEYYRMHTAILLVPAISVSVDNFITLITNLISHNPMPVIPVSSLLLSFLTLPRFPRTCR